MSLPTGDEYTDAWYRQQFRGVERWLAKVCSEEAEHSEQVRQMREELKLCRAERAQDVAKIGELQSEIKQNAQQIAELTKRLDEAGKIVGALKKKLEKKDTTE